MPLTYVGSYKNTTTDAITELPLPAGTQVGDLAAVVGLRQEGLDVTDVRFDEVLRPSLDDGVWVCGALDSLNPVAVDIPSGGLGHRQVVLLVVWRGSLGITDTAAVTAQTSSNIHLPLLDTTQTDAIALAVGFTTGFVSGEMGADLDGDWTLRDVAGASSDAAAWQWRGTGIPPAGDIVYGADSTWSAVVLGILTEQPPVRQYPRDDGLGHSSAARKYPPVKSRRVIGGYT